MTESSGHEPRRPPEPGVVFPRVISASRVTDIPAFHARWFMERLRAGHCVRVNPRNRAQRQVISFARCEVIVFWSKNPAPLFPWLEEIRERGFEYYVQFTLNDYEKEKLEPGLPPLEARLETFLRLSERIGPERVIWRWDPLLLGGGLEVPELLERAGRLGDVLHGATRKLVFSFVDMYGKTRRALYRHDPGLRAPAEEEMRALAAGLAARNAARNPPLELATCAEAGNFSPRGIIRNACVDPELIRRLRPEPALTGEGRQPTLPGLIAPPRSDLAPDPSRRPLCGCAESRDIGAYDTCLHGCVYCYAHNSEAAVRRRVKACLPDAESL